MVLFHRLLAWRVTLTARQSFWWWPLESRAAGGRGNIELSFEVLNLEPERKVLLAKVVPQKITKEIAQCRIVDDELQPLRVALLYSSIRCGFARVSGIELLGK